MTRDYRKDLHNVSISIIQGFYGGRRKASEFAIAFICATLTTVLECCTDEQGEQTLILAINDICELNDKLFHGVDQSITEEDERAQNIIDEWRKK